MSRALRVWTRGCSAIRSTWWARSTGGGFKRWAIPRSPRGSPLTRWLSGLQTSAPEVMDLRSEGKETLELYGADPDKPSFARAACWPAG